MAQQDFNYGGVDFPDPDEKRKDEQPAPEAPTPEPEPYAPAPEPYGPPTDYGGYGEPEGAWQDTGSSDSGGGGGGEPEGAWQDSGSSAPAKPTPPAADSFTDWVTRRAANNPPQQGGYEPQGAWAEVPPIVAPPMPPDVRPEFLGVAG